MQYEEKDREMEERGSGGKRDSKEEPWKEGKKKREKAKNINQSWCLGELAHGPQSNTQAQCEQGQ